MKKSPGKHILGMTVWCITALAAIHLGLYPLGYNIFDTQMFMNMSIGFIDFIHYIFGIAGIISLVIFFRALSSGKCCG